MFLLHAHEVWELLFLLHTHELFWKLLFLLHTHEQVWEIRHLASEDLIKNGHQGFCITERH